MDNSKTGCDTLFSGEKRRGRHPDPTFLQRPQRSAESEISRRQTFESENRVKIAGGQWRFRNPL